MRIEAAGSALVKEVKAVDKTRLGERIEAAAEAYFDGNALKEPDVVI